MSKRNTTNTIKPQKSGLQKKQTAAKEEEDSHFNDSNDGVFEDLEQKILDEEKKSQRSEGGTQYDPGAKLINDRSGPLPGNENLYDTNPSHRHSHEFANNQLLAENSSFQEPNSSVRQELIATMKTPLGANKVTPADQGSMMQSNKEWWPMRIGASQGSHSFEKGLNDDDVFPMSVKYTPKEKRTITIVRFVTLLAVIYALIPINFYYTIPGLHIRLGYFATDYYYHTIEFSQLPKTGFNSTLQNCKVNWRVLENHSNSSFDLEYVFIFGTEHKFNGTSLTIMAPEETSDCIINFYLPGQGVGLPRFVFEMYGESDQQEFVDLTPTSVALNFSGGISVHGETAHFSFENQIISSLNISLTLSYLYIHNTFVTFSNISIATGLTSVRFPSKYEKNIVSLTQPSGYMCTYAPYSQLDKDQCTKDTLTLKKCTTTGYLCSTKVDTCSSGGSAPDSTLILNLADGPIQVRYNDDEFTKNGPATNYTPPVTFNKTIAFTQLSQTLLNDSLTGYLLDDVSDRVSQLNFAGIEYERTWTYTNRLVYFESQFWPIVWASLGLLNPYMDNAFLNMIDSHCPARDLSMLQFIDMDVKEYLKDYYPSTETSEVALVKGYSGFVRLLLDNVGEIQYTDITIDENPPLIAAMAISAAIAILGALLMVQVAYMVFKVGTKKYGEWVQSRRQFAITKKQYEIGQEKGGSFEDSINFEMQASQNVIEVRGLFYTYLRPMTQVELKRNYQYSFSIFYVPTLFIDYSLRQRVDSLTMFLLKIPVNREQFSLVKQERKLNVSMPLTEFKKIYSQFCIREGYTEEDVESEEAKETFDHFKMKLDNSLGQELPAYGNIRLKSMKEKSMRQTVGNDKEGHSIIEEFLHEECVQSQFPSDFIYYTELREAFEAFCQKQGVEASQQENIIGSEYLANFGAVKREAPPPVLVFGVKINKDAENPGPQNNFGLIRIPSDRRMNYFSGLLKPEGIIANVVMTLIHIILIVAIPIFTPIISFFAISSMTIISEDIHALTITFQDTFMANEFNPWWKNVPGIEIWMYIQLMLVVFIFFAIIELISFYLTGLLNLGKYPVMYTIDKKIFNYFFKIILAVFLFLYLAMLWFGLVWAVLAAIINPTVFLPYAAASITLFATVTSKIVYYRSEYNRVIKRFDKVIADKISLIVEASIDKLKKITKDALGSIHLPLGNDEFHKEFDQHFDQVFDKASKTMQEIARDGGISKASAIAKMASQALSGLQSNVIEFCIGVITKNITQIQDSLKRLSIELNIDFDLLESVVEIVMNGYNPDVEGQDELLGQAEIQIKRLFRKLIPTMDVEPIGDLLHILIKGDVGRMKRFLEELETSDLVNNGKGAAGAGSQRQLQVPQKIYPQLFKMLIYQSLDDKQNIKNEILSFLHQIQEDQVSDIDKNKVQGKESDQDKVKNTLRAFETLQLLRDGQISCLTEDIDQLDGVNEKSNQLQFPNNFPLLSLVAFSKKSSTLTNTVIGHIFKEIALVNQVITQEERKAQVEMSLTSEQVQDPIEKLFMALYIALNGMTLELGSIGISIQKKDPGFDIGLLKVIHLCANNSPPSFESIIYSLGCAKNINVLMELYDIVWTNPVDPVYILKTLEVDVEKGKEFINLITVLYNILKFELLFRKVKNKGEKGGEEEDGQRATFGNSEFKNIRKKLLKQIPQLRSSFKMTGFFEHRHFKGMKENEFNEVQPSQQQARPSSASSNDINSSRGSLNTDQRDDLEEQELPGFKEEKQVVAGEQAMNEERKLEIMIKKAFSDPSSNTYIDEGFHQKIWEALIENDKLKRVFKDRALIVARCYAIIMLRNDYLLSQENKDYEKCIKKLAEEIEIESEKLEFLVDIISGDPLDIFKASPKQPSYSIQDEDLFAVAGQAKNEKCYINARFDSLRINLLEQLLKADKQYLPFACLKWYHHQRFFRESEQDVSFILKFLGVKREFYEIMELVQADNQGSIQLDEQFVRGKFIRYLGQQLTAFGKKMSREKMGQKQQIPISNDYRLTSEIFKEEEENTQYPPNTRFIAEGEKVEITEITGKNGLLQAMQTLLKIKQIKRKTMYQLIYGVFPQGHERTREQKQREHNTNILVAVLQGVSGERSPAQALKILYNISGLVQGFSFRKPVSPQDRTLFIQYGILCSAGQFKAMCQTLHIDKAHMEKSLDLVIQSVNDSRAEALINKLEPIERIGHENYPRLLSTLYLSGFFQELATKMFSFLDPGTTLNDKQCNAIVGVLFGAATKDLELTRFAAIQLLENHSLNFGVLTGVAAALTGDIKAEVSLKQFCKTADIDGVMLMNILDYMSSTPQNLPLVLTYLLSYLTRDQQKTCGSLIHIIKKDISMCPILATRLGTTAQQLMPVLACATGDFKVLPEYYRELAKKLDLENPSTVQCITELVHGKDRQIDKLAKIKSKRFTIDQLEIVSSVFTINYYGKQFYESFIKDVSKTDSLGNSLQSIYSKLGDEFKLDEDDEESVSQFVNCIIPSCWGSNEALRDTLKVLKKLPEYSIWSEKFKATPKNMGLTSFADQEVLVYLKRKLRRVATDIVTLKASISSEQSKMLIDLKQGFLPVLAEMLQVVLVKDPKQQNLQQEVPQKNEQMEKAINDRALEFFKNSLIAKKSNELEGQSSDLEKHTNILSTLKIKQHRLGYQIGCTYSFGLNRKFKQPYYICLDCNKQLDENFSICAVCVMFCHAGHNVRVGNFGQPGKIVCHCGQGKFNGICPILNKANPISEFNGQKACKLVRPSYEVFQERAIRETFLKGADNKTVEDLYKSDHSKVIFINDTEDNYSTFEFVQDLNNAFKLPNYFKVKNADEMAKIPRLANIVDKKHLKFYEGISYLEDQQLGINLSLVEQVILLGFGQATQSFLSILSSKKYSYEDYLNQSLYQTEGKVSAYLNQFRTMSAFVAISAVDIPRVIEFGDTLAEALEESGPDAVSNMCCVIRLARGGTLPSQKLFDIKATKATQYMKLFERLFGGVYQRVLSVHILLQQPDDKLVKIMGAEKSTASDSEASKQEINNIKEWVDQQLFSYSLQLEDKPKEYVRNMIALSCGNMNGFDFVMREMKVHPQITTQYKAIIRRDVKELQPIFEKLKKMIPVKFNNFMLNVWQGEKDAVIKFIIQYLVINRTISKRWDSFEEDKLETSLEPKQVKQKEYLMQVYALMSEDTPPETIQEVLERINHKKLYDYPEVTQQDKIFFYQKATYAINCVQSVFFGTVLGISEVAQVLFDQDTQKQQVDEYQKWQDSKNGHDERFRNNVPKPPAEVTINALAHIVNGCWSKDDIEIVLEALEVSSYYSKPAPMSYFVNTLLACEGDLVALAKVDDEICQQGSTHIRSLLASILCGYSKYENLQTEIYERLCFESQHLKPGINKNVGENVQGEEELKQDPNLFGKATQIAQRQKNLLLREIYRIYEKICQMDGNWKNQNHKKIDDFIKWSFDQKVPLHFLMMLSQSSTYIEKLFKPQEEFVSNLKFKNREEQNEQIVYLNRLIDFFDPYTDDDSIIQHLLSTIMEHKKDQQEEKKGINVKIQKVNRVKRFGLLNAQTDLLLESLSEDEKLLQIYQEDTPEEVTRKQAFNSRLQIINNIKADLGFENSDHYITLNLLSFSKLLSSSYQLDPDAIGNLFQVFVKLYDKDIVLQNIYGLVYKVTSNKKDETLDLFSAVTALVVASNKRKDLEKSDVHILMMISKWLHTIAIMLDKERKFADKDELVQKTIQEALDFTIKCCEGQEFPLAKYKGDIFYVVDVFFGIMNICKHDFKKMRSIAVKVGGFPSIQKLESFFYLIKKNKEVITFDPLIVNTGPSMAELIPEENTALGMDTRAIFNFFAKKGQGKIGIEDFQDAVKYMGINLTVPQQLNIFSKVDTNKSGDLNFAQFLRAIAELKKIVITQAIANLGLSVADLVRAFITSIVILILLFVFIFISINAFAHPTTFSSVTNSILPIIAGAGASKSGTKKGDEDDTNYEEEVDNIIK